MIFAPHLLLIALSFHVASSPGAAQIVDLGYAQYQGTVDSADNQTQFLGIRYAAPPLGKFVMYENQYHGR